VAELDFNRKTFHRNRNEVVGTRWLSLWQPATTKITCRDSHALFYAAGQSKWSGPRLQPARFFAKPSAIQRSRSVILPRTGLTKICRSDSQLAFGSKRWAFGPLVGLPRARILVAARFSLDGFGGSRRVRCGASTAIPAAVRTATGITAGRFATGITAGRFATGITAGRFATTDIAAEGHCLGGFCFQRGGTTHHRSQGKCPDHTQHSTTIHDLSPTFMTLKSAARTLRAARSRSLGREGEDDPRFWTVFLVPATMPEPKPGRDGTQAHRGLMQEHRTTERGPGPLSLRRRRQDP
jgi:hypothetical protein